MEESKDLTLDELIVKNAQLSDELENIKSQLLKSQSANGELLAMLNSRQVAETESAEELPLNNFNDLIKRIEIRRNNNGKNS